MVKEVYVLGFYLNQKGIRADPAKVSSILAMDYPRTMKECKGFLGCMNYLSSHIKGMQAIAKGLIEFTKGGAKAKFVLTEEGKASFDALKEALASAVNLNYPDPKYPLLLQVDACDTAIASVLLQSQEGQIVAIGFHSKILSQTQ